MEYELLNQFQFLAFLIGFVGVHTYMPIVLYCVWKSHKNKEEYDFSALDGWAFISFVGACISVILIFMFITIPTFIDFINAYVFC